MSGPHQLFLDHSAKSRFLLLHLVQLLVPFKAFVSVSYCCVTKHLKTLWLKTTILHYHSQLQVGCSSLIKTELRQLNFSWNSCGSVGGSSDPHVSCSPAGTRLDVFSHGNDRGTKKSQQKCVRSLKLKTDTLTLLHTYHRPKQVL